MAWCSMLMQVHSGEIAPTIMEALTGVQLCMVKDPGVRLLGRWIRNEMAVPSLPQLWEVVGEIHQIPTLSSLAVEIGGEGVTHWLPKGSSSVGVGGTSFPGPGIRAKGGMIKEGEDMRDELIHSLLGGNHSTGYPGIDSPPHGLGSSDSVAPSLGVWAVLYVVVNSTRPCPTGALV